MTRIDALRALEKAVEAGEWKPLVARDVFGSTKDPYYIAYRTFHGSLDAAKALHEALIKVPDVDIEYRLFGALCDVTIYDVVGGQAKATSIHGPARAWLLAIIRALIAQEGGE